MTNQINLISVGQSFETKSDAQISTQISDSKSTKKQISDITLFTDINLTINQGESYSIVGPSGSGKSTLLMLMSGLAKPTTGKIEYIKNGKSSHFQEHPKDIGFIFQHFHLIPELNVLNNVALPLRLRGEKDALERAAEQLKRVGLEHRQSHLPSQLSGGEQQRVAIARALVFNPLFIFADEPTGNLDSENAKQVAKLLLSSCAEQGAALVIVTHDKNLAHQTQHQLNLADEQQLFVVKELAS